MPRTSGPRFYKAGGECIWEVPCSTKAGKRPPTIADAKKSPKDDPYLPSTTEVIGVQRIAKLEEWKQKERIRCAYDNPRHAGEPEDEYVARIWSLSNQAMSRPASLGSEFHKRAELWDKENAFREPSSLYDEKMLNTMLKAYRVWADTNILRMLSIEKSFGIPDYGYGGRSDRLYINQHGKRVVMDIKTMSTRAGHAVKGYVEWGQQLAAYQKGMGEPPATRLLNVVVSTTEPGRLETVDWTKDQPELWKAFQLCLGLWFLRNKYDPRGSATKDKDT